MAVIDLILSLDATIMLDDLHVEGSYAPLVVELLPALLGDKRRLRLQGLPAVHCELASASRHSLIDTRLYKLWLVHYFRWVSSCLPPLSSTFHRRTQ